MDERSRTTSRRAFVASAIAGTTLLAGCNGNSESQAVSTYPSEALSCIVPFGQGGGTDTYARQIMPAVSEELGANIGVRNEPGASSLKGVGELVQTKGDGYTFGVFNPPSTPISYLVYDPGWNIRSLVPVCAYGSTPYAIFARTDLEIGGLTDLIERYQRGDLSVFAGLGRGGIVHVAANVMRNEYNMAYDRYVSYGGGGPAIRAAVSGEVPVVGTTDTAATGAVESGDLEPISILASGGSSIFPDAPTPSDEGYTSIDYIGQLTRCMFFPEGTPDRKRDQLANSVKAAVQRESVQSWASQTGNTVEFGGPNKAEAALDDAITNIKQRVDIEEIIGGQT